MRRISMLIALGTMVMVTGACTKKLRVTKYPDGYELGHYAGDGGVVLIREAEEGENGQKRAICVAPPSQATTTIKVEAKNGVKATVKEVEVGVDTNNKVEESLHSLYEQGQATLYIQFMAYRLCEARLNDWITADEYQTKLTDIMEMGEDLLKVELSREVEDTKQAGEEAKKAETELKGRALQILTDPAIDSTTKSIVPQLAN